MIFQGTNYLYPSLQGYITFVSLLFPLIRPHKVVHNTLKGYEICDKYLQYSLVQLQGGETDG